MTPARMSPLAEEATMWPRVLRRTRRRSAIMVSGAAAPSRGGVGALRRQNSFAIEREFDRARIPRASRIRPKGGDTLPTPLCLASYV